MTGIAYRFITGIVAIILCIIFWAGLNYAMSIIADVLISVANDATATANIMVGKAIMEWCILGIIIVIFIVILRPSTDQYGVTE